MKTNSFLAGLALFSFLSLAPAEDRVSAPAGNEAPGTAFAWLDRNGDGVLGRDEIPRWFDRLDVNRDGGVTQEEARAAASRRRMPGGATGPQASPPSSPVLETKKEVRYAHAEGAAALSQSLDIYAPPGARSLPVLVFVHGGGWRRGDKGNAGAGPGPAAFYCGEGFVYVSINYRLTPAGKHPVNIQDVAKAVAWVHDHIAEHGGDPARISIAGHSAGAHLASLVASDARWLKAEGKSLAILQRAILLDTAAYDIPRYMEEFASEREGAGMERLYRDAFGETEEHWRDASPQAHLAPGSGIPSMLVFFTGSRMAANALAPAFAAALTQAGAPSRAIDTVTLSHGEILSKSWEKGHPLSQTVLRFLRGEDVSAFPARLDGTPVQPPT